MPISDASFDDEAELQTWTFSNASLFFGQCTLLPGFNITTPAGKRGVPDAFAFNFANRQWWVVECELLVHGVWPHIAEQITRFVVAAHNPGTLRAIRDKLFEKILKDDQIEATSKALNTTVPRLLQQLELFIESITPSLAIFIDETNQDLSDCCNALDIDSEIYRIKKFIVNGNAEYYSPDRNQPAVSFDGAGTDKPGSAAFDVIDLLGGGEVISSKNRCYRLTDGRIVKIQFSKLHDQPQVYWYGINPVSYNYAKSVGCTDFVFILGDEGFLLVPLKIIDAFLQHAWVTKNTDGTIRHYHVHITPPPDVALKGEGSAVDVSVYFQTF